MPSQKSNRQEKQHVSPGAYDYYSPAPHMSQSTHDVIYATSYLKQDLGQVAGRCPERGPVAVVGYSARVGVEEGQRVCGREQRGLTAAAAAAAGCALGLVLVGEGLPVKHPATKK